MLENNPKKNKIFVFDLDDTLCITTNGDYGNSIPVVDRIALLNKLYDEGNTIIIDTARGTETGINWLDFTEKQLDSWGLKYHTLRCGWKIVADLYIDDKAINVEDFFS